MQMTIMEETDMTRIKVMTDMKGIEMEIDISRERRAMLL
jgi:hypothetical protein